MISAISLISLYLMVPRVSLFRFFGRPPQKWGNVKFDESTNFFDLSKIERILPAEFSAASFYSRKFGNEKMTTFWLCIWRLNFEAWDSRYKHKWS